jgi:hypothetical protein
MVRRDGRIHALGRFHIGGDAYCVWALPPIDSTVMGKYSTVADAVIEAQPGSYAGAG